MWRPLVLLVLLVAACGDGQGGDEGACEETAGGDTDTDADTDADTDTDTDADGDSDPDPFDPDPEVSFSLDGGDVGACLPGLLDDGDAGTYAGWYDGDLVAYFAWLDDWDSPSMRFRVEVWSSYTDATVPGTYTLTAADVDYTTCGICVFAETAAGEFWASEGDVITFTEITTGTGGIGQPLAGTFEGSLTGEECGGTATISFSGTARDTTFGPL